MPAVPTNPPLLKPATKKSHELRLSLSEILVGQATPIDDIIPYVQTWQAGLSRPGRPVGVFLLLGPTGTGKTRTAEALAVVLHGSDKKLLRINCGEFQMEHEVAKLIGAPPGYLGHRETSPALTQQKLSLVTSDKSTLSILLFDEIEKGAPSMQRLLLGILDQSKLQLGDGTTACFDSTLILMTSNLGARTMQNTLRPVLGFETSTSAVIAPGKLDRIGVAAVRRKFSPEFVNRIDRVLTYQPLTSDALQRILGLLWADLQRHLDQRLLTHSVPLTLTDAGMDWLLAHGTSVEYGARELKRVLDRHVLTPLVAMLMDGELRDGVPISVSVDSTCQLTLTVQ